MKTKPVIMVSVKTMWDYEYQAKCGDEIYASDSLRNLKEFIRIETWYRLAWITTNSGSMSYGQNVVEEYPYRPRRL
jgi:hypothetical protein